MGVNVVSQSSNSKLGEKLKQKYLKGLVPRFTSTEALVSRPTAG